MKENHRRGINYLKRITKKLDEVSYQELCIDANSCFSSIPISYYQTDEIKNINEVQPRDQSIIFRARENEISIPERGSIKFPFQQLQEISIISEKDLHKIDSFGRCNKKEEARFYASSDYYTAAIEALTNGFVEQPQSRQLTLGAWKIKEPLNLAQINYSEEAIQKFYKYDEKFYGEILKYARNLNKHYNDQLVDQNDSDREFAMKIMKICADEFAKTEIKSDCDYMISNYFCDKIFEETFIGENREKIDGILYPSVSYSYQNFNVVLHRRAMEKLKFISAMLIWVSYGSKNDKVHFMPLEHGIKVNDEGYLQWNKFKI